MCAQIDHQIDGRQRYCKMRSITWTRGEMQASKIFGIIVLCFLLYGRYCDSEAERVSGKERPDIVEKRKEVESE